MTTLISLLSVTPVLADCAYPTKPAAPPSGAKATQDEMVAAMKATRQFDADVKTYQACIDGETEAQIKALGEKATAEDIKRIKDSQALKAKTAYDDATKVAEAFNVELRAFKSK